MLPIIQDLFVRVIKRKLKEENTNIDEVLQLYPKLSVEDKIKLKQCIEG